MRIFIVLIMVMSALAPARAAEVYKWTDDNGRVQYGDRVPEDKKAAARMISLANSELTDSQRLEAKARLDKILADAQKTAPPQSPKIASIASPPPATPTSSSACEEAWKKYNASYACFDPYRISGGRVRPEAYLHCKAVPQPERCE